MARNPLIALLNQDLSDELGSTIQYLHHHWTAEGIDAAAVIDMFEATAKEEMKHAEMLAERIVQLGGEPVVHPRPDQAPTDLRDMLAADLEEERVANDAIRSLIKHAGEDPTTRLMLEEILADGEEHAHAVSRLLK